MQVDGVGVHLEGLPHLTVSGQLSLATVTPKDIPTRYTALRMGDVTVSGEANLGLDLSAELTIESLDANRVATGFERLDWSTAFSFGAVDPGADLPTASPLPIDFDNTLELRVTGTLTGTASYTFDHDFDGGTPAITIHSYSPPLMEVAQYRVDENGVLRRETEHGRRELIDNTIAEVAPDLG